MPVYAKGCLGLSATAIVCPQWLPGNKRGNVGNNYTTKIGKKE